MEYAAQHGTRSAHGSADRSVNAAVYSTTNIHVSVHLTHSSLDGLDRLLMETQPDEKHFRTFTCFRFPPV